MAGTQRGKEKGRTVRARLVGFNFADNNGKPRAVWKKAMPVCRFFSSEGWMKNVVNIHNEIVLSHREQSYIICRKICATGDQLMKQLSQPHKKSIL